MNRHRVRQPKERLRLPIIVGREKRNQTNVIVMGIHEQVHRASPLWPRPLCLADATNTVPAIQRPS